MYRGKLPGRYCLGDMFLGDISIGDITQGDNDRRILTGGGYWPGGDIGQGDLGLEPLHIRTVLSSVRMVDAIFSLPVRHSNTMNVWLIQLIVLGTIMKLFARFAH